MAAAPPAGLNRLYYGDNLEALHLHIADASVDLVDVGPPFKSDRDYNAFFEKKDGSRAAAQIKAFEDTTPWAKRPRVHQRRIGQPVGAAAVSRDG